MNPFDKRYYQIIDNPYAIIYGDGPFLKSFVTGFDVVGDTWKMGFRGHHKRVIKKYNEKIIQTYR